MDGFGAGGEVLGIRDSDAGLVDASEMQQMSES